MTDKLDILVEGMNKMSAIMADFMAIVANEKQTSKAETGNRTGKRSQCRGKRSDGLPCNASGNLLDKTGYCYHHRYQSDTMDRETETETGKAADQMVTLAQACDAIAKGFQGVYRLPVYPVGGKGRRSRKAFRRPIREAIQRSGFRYAKHTSKKNRTVYTDGNGRKIVLHFANRYLKVN